MPQNNLESREWIVKAQNDLKSAEILYKEKGPTDSLCFHCHQVIEKTLKAFLIFKKKKVPRVHDLIHLLNLCKKADNNLEKFSEKVSFLNRYYIETRYPSEIIAYSRKECEEALDIAQELFQIITNKII